MKPELLERITAGVAVAIYGAVATPGDVIGYLAIAAGGFTALTCVFGFCSVCEMVGRKLK